MHPPGGAGIASRPCHFTVLARGGAASPSPSRERPPQSDGPSTAELPAAAAKVGLSPAQLSLSHRPCQCSGSAEPEARRCRSTARAAAAAANMICREPWYSMISY